MQKNRTPRYQTRYVIDALEPFGLGMSRFVIHTPRWSDVMYRLSFNAPSRRSAGPKSVTLCTAHGMWGDPVNACALLEPIFCETGRPGIRSLTTATTGAALLAKLDLRSVEGPRQRIVDVIQNVHSVPPSGAASECLGRDCPSRDMSYHSIP